MSLSGTHPGPGRLRNSKTVNSRMGQREVKMGAVSSERATGNSRTTPVAEWGSEKGKRGPADQARLWVAQEQLSIAEWDNEK